MFLLIKISDTFRCCGFVLEKKKKIKSLTEYFKEPLNI